MGITTMDDIHCDREECVNYDGKRCRKIGCQPCYVCEPMASLLFKLHGPGAKDAAGAIVATIKKMRDLANEAIGG